MHHQVSNETDKEKSRWDLCKNSFDCFEQILEATFHKTTAVRPPTSYLTNHLVKAN